MAREEQRGRIVDDERFAELPPEERPVYPIGVVARMFGVHPQTLRLYEKEGLIKPYRTPGGTRLYSQKDVSRLAQITRLTQELGVNLAGVDIILRLLAQMEKMKRREQAILSAARQLLGDRFDKLQEMVGDYLGPEREEEALVPVSPRPPAVPPRKS